MINIEERTMRYLLYIKFVLNLQYGAFVVKWLSLATSDMVTSPDIYLNCWGFLAPIYIWGEISCHLPKVRSFSRLFIITFWSSLELETGDMYLNYTMYFFYCVIVCLYRIVTIQSDFCLANKVLYIYCVITILGSLPLYVW